MPAAAAPSPEGWGLATRLETSDVGLAYSVRSSTNGGGVAMYTWTQTEGAVDLIHARSFDLVRGWGETAIIQTDTSASGDGSYPVVDGNGNAVAVWIHFGASHQAWAARYDARLGWSPAETIGTPSPDIGILRAAIDGSGNVYAVWQQSDGVKNDMWSNRYVVGTGWGAAVRIETGDGGAVQPSVSADAGGNAIAVWAQTESGVRSVFANRFTAGAWGTETLIESNDAGNVSRPFVALTADGRAAAAWSQSDGTRWSTWSAFYTPGSGWGAPLLVENDDSADANVTAVGIDGSGNATTAFLRCDPICVGWAARSDGSSGWQAPFQITAPGTQYTTNARLGANSRGDVAIISLQQNGSRYDVWVSMFTPAGGWQAPTPIETDNSAGGSTVWIVLDESGNAFASWDDYNGIVASAWANVFRAPVPPDTSVQDHIDALEAQLRGTRDELNDTQSQLRNAQDDLDEARINNAKVHNDLANATGTIAALSGQVLALSILATVGMLAALGAIGLTMVQAGRAKEGEGAPRKEKGT